MELWGFESIRNLPGDGFGLFDIGPKQERTRKREIEADLELEKYRSDNELKIAEQYAAAQTAEATASREAKLAEVTAMADARKEEARLSAETRKTEAIERADTSRHESDNTLRAEKDSNMTQRFGIMKNSQDTQWQVLAWLTGQLEGFDTKTQIAMKDAEVRIADIRSTQRVEEGKLKVDERELEIRALEAARAGNIDTGGFTA